MNRDAGYKRREGSRKNEGGASRMMSGTRRPFFNYCLLLIAHAVDAPLVDDDDPLAEREEARELRLAADEREVLLGAELERRLGQFGLGLELRVHPHVVAQVEGLLADLAHGRRRGIGLDADDLLLRAVALALL